MLENEFMLKRISGFVFGVVIIFVSFSLAAAADTDTTSAGACSDPAFREQDFAIGSWEVTRGWPGPKIAEVTVARKLDGCALTFEWDRPGEPNRRVDGFFAYSPLNGAWLFAYATEYATSEYFVGHKVGEARIDYTPVPRITEEGKLRQQKWTLSLRPDGRVSERMLRSDDGGKTWEEAYDLIWSRKPAQP